MSIQSTNPHTGKASYNGLKDSSFTSIERDFLEKADSLLGVDKLGQSKFGDIIDTINALQSKSLQKKDSHSQHSKTSEKSDFKPSKDHSSFSSNSMVKLKDTNRDPGLNGAKEKKLAPANEKEKIEEIPAKRLSDNTVSPSEEKTQKQNVLVGELPELSETDQSSTKNIQDDQDLYQTNISLTSSFLQDTLSEINTKQNQLLEISSEALKGAPDHLLQGDLGSVVDNDLIQVEALAAPLQEKKILSEDQLKLINVLLLDHPEIIMNEVETQKEYEVASESESKINFMKEKGLDEISEAIEDPFSKQTQIEKSKAPEEKRVDKAQDVSLTLSQHTNETVPISEPQPNFRMIGGDFSKSFLGGGLIIGDVSPQPFVIAKSGLGAEGSMAQLKLDQINTLMQVKDHFKTMLNNKESHLRVILDPDDLGTVEISFDILKDTVISTFIKAEKRETMELLARHADEIDQIFKEAGLQSDLTNMNFSSNQQGYNEQEDVSWDSATPKVTQGIIDNPDLVNIPVDSDALIVINA